MYHAINLTVELQYKVPMQRIYDILEKMEKYNEQNEDKITSQEILELLEELGRSLEEESASENPVDPDEDGSGGELDLREKIKELLRLLGCRFSNQELNQILKGEKDINDILPAKAKIVWVMVFSIDSDGRVIPDQNLVNQFLTCTELIAVQNVEQQIQKMQIEKKITRDRLQSDTVQKDENLKTMFRKEKEKYDPVLLERKRAKLKLYIAHMQGYDLDLDRDGQSGIDWATGEIIDLGDIDRADGMTQDRSDIK